MVAISIILVGLLSTFALLSRSLSLNRSVANQFIGTYLAMEGIELTKNLIDRNVIQDRPWNENLSPGDYELDYNATALSFFADKKIKFDTATGIYSYDFGADTTYVRRVTIEQPTPNEIRVISNVSWVGQGGVTSNIALEDHFFNWH